MGKIVVSENITVDGVVQDPTGEEGAPGGGWFARITDADRAAFATYFTEEAYGAEALLFGRRSHAWFATRWAARTGPWAERLTALPKYVVSTGTADPGWTNSTLLDPADIPALRDKLDGDLVVYGSPTLAHALFADGLVDEVRLLVYPAVAGRGDRLFPDTPVRLGRTAARPLGDTLTVLGYEVLR